MLGSEQWLTFRSLVTLIRSVIAIYVESSGKTFMIIRLGVDYKSQFTRLVNSAMVYNL